MKLVCQNSIRVSKQLSQTLVKNLDASKGKQEIDAAIFSRARVFTDEVAQSITIGEAQHAVANGLIEASSILELGAVINSDCAGRTSDEDITIFDGTGVGLQDLAVAAEVLERAIDAGVAQAVDF